MTLQEQFGQIDIYLFDQILRGNIEPPIRVLDAGCGFGRNLVYLLREGCEAFAVDSNAHAVEYVRRLADSLGNSSPAENFRVSPVEQMLFPDAIANLVICSAVHRGIKFRTGPMLAFKNFESAAVTIGGVELLRRIHKNQFALSKLAIKGQTAPAIWNAVLAP